MRDTDKSRKVSRRLVVDIHSPRDAIDLCLPILNMGSLMIRLRNKLAFDSPEPKTHSNNTILEVWHFERGGNPLIMLVRVTGRWLAVDRVSAGSM